MQLSTKLIVISLLALIMAILNVTAIGIGFGGGPPNYVKPLATCTRICVAWGGKPCEMDGWPAASPETKVMDGGSTKSCQSNLNRQQHFVAISKSDGSVEIWSKGFDSQRTYAVGFRVLYATEWFLINGGDARCSAPAGTLTDFDKLESVRVNVQPL